ncbi:MAG: hypothetical protein LBH45_01805 [Campylobacteraceae bacterium]|nr:hypothetical protein [Campylobacteraceae bacterium]
MRNLLYFHTLGYIVTLLILNAKNSQMINAKIILSDKSRGVKNKEALELSSKTYTYKMR